MRLHIPRCLTLLTASCALFALGLAVAQEEEPVGRAPLVGDVANGTRLYRMNCAVCHGFDGSGAGPAKVTLRTPPADHRDGSLMNARDDRMLMDVIRAGCANRGCSKAMPGFSAALDDLETWDVVAYLRSLHLPLSFFFPRLDQYVVKTYAIGTLGNEDFQKGQRERLQEHVGKLDPKQGLPHTVFTLFREDKHRVSPELVPQDPRRLALLKKESKLGYVLFLELAGPRGGKVPVGLALDRNYTITKMVTTLTDPALAGEYNKRLEKYVGMGQRGEKPAFSTVNPKDKAKDKVALHFDKEVTRTYAVAVEAANCFELEERDRSWADDTF
ncbi:MAG TPA: cytochrome c [Myxococcota bacterium]|nr:cytochrome c [Myxococcota bacterium]HRY96857.1 cytochrome c [Myxococcota bacterium]HSA22542.1 cytochrome c [Myxococcota bacterium]